MRETTERRESVQAMKSKGLTAREMTTVLRAQGFCVSLRTVERDLKAMESKQ